MSSTKITINEAQEFLKEFDKAYRLFYRNSSDYLKLSNRRSSSKSNLYYKQASKDVREFVDAVGFSSSWIWSLFIDKQLKKTENKRRYFSDDYIEHFENLIIFYQDHIFVSRDKEGCTQYIKSDTSSPENFQGENVSDSKSSQTLPEKEEFDAPKETIIQNVQKTKSKSIVGTKEKINLTQNKTVFQKLTSTPSMRVFMVFILIVLAFTIYSAVQLYQTSIENEQKAEKRRNIIETSKSKSSTRSLELTNLINEIHKELKEDYLSDKKRNLSPESISRIISLSEKFDPYLYLRNSKVISKPLSRERADLFRNIIDLNLEQNTYDRIFARANFSHSDFSYMDFSSFNLSELVTGVTGGITSDEVVLITSTKRPNLTNSDFTEANLSYSDLYGDFSGSDFSKAKMVATTFDLSKISNANFSGNTVVFQVISSELTNCNFRDSNIYGGFYDSDLRGTVFDGSTISRVSDYDFEGKKPENIKVTGVFLPVFSNVFLSGDDLVYDISVEIKPVDNPKATFDDAMTDDFLSWGSNNRSGLALLSIRHRVKSYMGLNDTYIVSALRKNKKGKDAILVNVDFEELGSKSQIATFINTWKENSKNIYGYVIRANDHYRMGRHIYSPKRHFIDNNQIDYELDTLVGFIGKDFHFFKEKTTNESQMSLCETNKWKTNKTKATSFKNCTFNNTRISTKISGVSFEGSVFYNSTFELSELFNVNFKKTKGGINAYGLIKYDSLFVDKDFDWFSSQKQIDSILDLEVRLGDKNLNIRKYIAGRNLDSIESFMGTDSPFWRTLVRLKFLNKVKDRMIVIKSDDVFIIRDSIYTKEVKRLNELVAKNKKRKWSH